MRMCQRFNTNSSGRQPERSAKLLRNANWRRSPSPFGATQSFLYLDAQLMLLASRQASYIRINVSIAIIFIAAIFLNGCSDESESEPQATSQSTESDPFSRLSQDAATYACQTTGDCVRVDADCCGCSSGGTGAAINKKYEKKWNDLQSGSCGGTVCLAYISTDPSCVEPIECRDKMCIVPSGRYPR
jgi:hypothetical protein